ncbi:succinylglutamate desuccinylase/aspartoacylase family protein [Luteolibacter pohnpeiensis]|uniref:Succinylglutamate desuccinylase/aspartoacylase family protein n=1 Tax=Luteolibacter pohnpeiensis TaxID=454153 RepID=A0A934S615_9BACT|nr:BPL-N domain-containing protein [Luteolibacter pohnpeiensis]MBK1881416.1 succinylglutamate desuccinylase/aspartoacylase family protein [Luteolibacter pohnpeiensis]
MKWAISYLWLLFACVAFSQIETGIEQGEIGIEQGEIAAGSRWETPYFIIHGKEPGPKLILTGGVHGNEPAGSLAAEQIRNWNILRGTLVVIPRVNALGLEANTRFVPGAEQGEQDLNRNFPKPGSKNEATGALAKSLWEFVTEQKPDWLIDLHEGYGFHQLQPGSVGSSIIDSDTIETDRSVPSMLHAVNAGIGQEKLQFVNLSPPIKGSLARATAEFLGASTMILETTSKDQRLPFRVRQQRVMVHELLSQIGMIAPDATPSMTPPADGDGLKIAIFDDEGVSSNGADEVVKTALQIPRALAWRVDAEDIRDGALKRFDLVVFPGGSGSKEAAALQESGRGIIRDFVESGGGYVGICAGAYLAAANYPWSLRISNHQTFCESREVPGLGKKSMWYRGNSATVAMELSAAGKSVLGDFPDTLQVRYHNGPIVSAAGLDSLPKYQVLAWFRSEVSQYDLQQGTMTGTPAIISTEFGNGRVLCVSPHPESTDRLRPLLAHGMEWAGGR